MSWLGRYDSFVFVQTKKIKENVVKINKFLVNSSRLIVVAFGCVRE